MPDTRTASRLWQRMTAEQRLCAAYALWRDDEATSDQRQAALLIAQQRKFRPKTVIGLDEDRKAHHLASLSTLPERSEEHTSELQSQSNLVCRLLLDKKKTQM